MRVRFNLRSLSSASFDLAYTVQNFLPHVALGLKLSQRISNSFFSHFETPPVTASVSHIVHDAEHGLALWAKVEYHCWIQLVPPAIAGGPMIRLRDCHRFWILEVDPPAIAGGTDCIQVSLLTSRQRFFSLTMPLINCLPRNEIVSPGFIS